jgi:hypothetical protein
MRKVEAQCLNRVVRSSRQTWIVSEFALLRRCNVTSAQVPEGNESAPDFFRDLSRVDLRLPVC